MPTNLNGYLELPTGEAIGIERAHIEEDTGKTTHIGTSGESLGPTILSRLQPCRHTTN